MPTYEYKCLNCDTRFDQFQSITEDAIEQCPTCNGKVKRLIGAGAGLIFKGSGFYITDYRSDGYKESAKKDTESSSDSKKEKDSKSSNDKDSKSKSSNGGDSKSSKSESSKSKDS